MGKENRPFHHRLYFSVCERMAPAFTDFLDSLNENGTAQLADTPSLARFLLYGQIPILDGVADNEEKAERIRTYIKKLVR